MPRYLVQASISSQGISDLISNPEDRAAVIRQLVESVGGRLESYDYAFGEYDIVAIGELPDSITMSALSMAVLAAGAIKDIKTTVLMSVDEAMEAMRKASSIGYRPPSG